MCADAVTRAERRVCNCRQSQGVDQVQCESVSGFEVRAGIDTSFASLRRAGRSLLVSDLGRCLKSVTADRPVHLAELEGILLAHPK